MGKFIIDETRQLLDSDEFRSIFDRRLATMLKRNSNASPDLQATLERLALRFSTEEYVNGHLDDDSLTDPKHFAALAELTQEMDTETGHRVRDDMMIALLRRLGYGIAADIISDAPAWYA